MLPIFYVPKKIKSSEKQKCVYKLFLLKSKILKRLNHRITKNSQNCEENSQFLVLVYSLRKSYLYSLVPFFLVYSKIFNIHCSV